MPIIANTTSANTFSAVRAQLNSVTKRLNQFSVNESTLYANTINANVSLKLSGTDIRATFAQNTYVKSVLANTNLYIATRASWTELKATNTAIRALDTAKLSVANAVATYATKASPTTSGLLAHTGRATISTNLSVSGNTTLSGTLVANNTAGTAGHYLRTSGTGIYWSPVAAGGGGGAVGGGTDKIFNEQDNTITTNYTLTSNKNVTSQGPLTINNGVTVTIPAGVVWKVEVPNIGNGVANTYTA